MTSATATNNWGYVHFNGPFSSDTAKSSSDGKEVKDQFKLVRAQMETPASYNARVALLEAFDHSSGLASVSYLVKESGVPEEKLLNLLLENSYIRKSYLKTSQGDDVYCLDNKLNTLKEALIYIKKVSQLKF